MPSSISCHLISKRAQPQCLLRAADDGHLSWRRRRSSPHSKGGEGEGDQPKYPDRSTWWRGWLPKLNLWCSSRGKCLWRRHSVIPASSEDTRTNLMITLVIDAMPVSRIVNGWKWGDAEESITFHSVIVIWITWDHPPIRTMAMQCYCCRDYKELPGLGFN